MKALLYALFAALIAGCAAQTVYYQPLPVATAQTAVPEGKPTAWCAGDWLQSNGQWYCRPKTVYYPYYGYAPYYGPVYTPYWGFSVHYYRGGHRWH